MFVAVSAGLLAACEAGYPEPRPLAAPSRELAGAADRDFRGADHPSEPAAPRTWADSLDGVVFGTEPAGPPPGGDDMGPEMPAIEAARALAAFGTRALDEGATSEALRYFEAASRQAPPEERWIYLRVVANLHTGLRHDETALKCYLQLFELEPTALEQDVTLHGNLALVYYRLDRLAEARRAAERALELNPRFPEALRTLGLIALREGEVDGGVELLERAVAMKREIPEAQVALAEREAALGATDKAIGRYRYLLDVMGSADFRDPLGRWRNLFGARDKSPQDEFRDRIRRLESSGANPGHK